MADDLGRRALLKCGAACALASSCGKFVGEPIAIEAGAPVRGVLSVPMSRMPELQRTGGCIILHADATDLLGRTIALLVANTSSQGLRAFDAYCPHAGCEVTWVDNQDSVVCPCHLSKFSVDGAVTHPPANADLDTYPAKLSTDGQTLLVDLSGGGGAFPAAQSGQVTFAIGDEPALLQIGGSVTGHALGVPFPIVALRQSAAVVVAFDARCPHLGCAVRGAGQLFICPCHGSLFDIDGSLKLGPATSGLTELPTTFDGVTVTITVAR